MRTIACLVGGAALAASMVTAVPVSAAGQPSIHIKVPAAAKAGQPTKVKYSSTGLSGDSLVLQRANDNTHWHTIRHLSKPNGTTTVPKLAIGIYNLRIAAFTRKGGLVTADGHLLHVFGKVPFTKLFPQLGHGGTYQGGGNYRYAFAFYNTDGTYTALTVKNSPCNSVHVSFVPGTDTGAAPSWFMPATSTDHHPCGPP